MGESSFSIGEIKLITAAVFALLFINGIFVASGVFANPIAKPPSYQPSSNHIIQAGDMPELPSDSPAGPNVTTFQAQNTQDRLDTVHLLDGLLGFTETFWADYVQTKFVANGPDEANISISDGGNQVDKFVPLNETWVRYDVGDRVVNVRADDVPNTECVSWATACIEVTYDVTDKGGNLGLAGVVGFIGSIILWIPKLLIQIVTMVIVYIVELATFAFGLAIYIVSGWATVIGKLGSTHPFLPVIVIGVQVPLYIVAFNGVMKIVKALPTT